MIVNGALLIAKFLGDYRSTRVDANALELYPTLVGESRGRERERERETEREKEKGGEGPIRA